MTYDKLIRTIAGTNGLSIAQTRRVLDSFKAAVGTAVHAEGRIRVPGLGTFRLRKHAERTVFVPSSKQKVVIPPRNKVTLRADSKLCRG